MKPRARPLDTAKSPAAWAAHFQAQIEARQRALLRAPKYEWILILLFFGVLAAPSGVNYALGAIFLIAGALLFKKIVPPRTSEERRLRVAKALAERLPGYIQPGTAPRFALDAGLLALKKRWLRGQFELQDGARLGMEIELFLQLERAVAQESIEFELERPEPWTEAEFQAVRERLRSDPELPLADLSLEGARLHARFELRGSGIAEALWGPERAARCLELLLKDAELEPEAQVAGVDPEAELSWAAGPATKKPRLVELPAPVAERLSAQEWTETLHEKLRAIERREAWVARLGRLGLLLALLLLGYGSLHFFPGSGERMLRLWDGLRNFSLSLEDIQAAFPTEEIRLYWLEGVLASFIALVVYWPLAARIPVKTEPRRLRLPRALISWLSEELRPGSSVILALEAEPHRQDGRQRWLELSFSLKDRSKVALRAELWVHEEELREQLSIELQLLSPPSRELALGVLNALRRGVSDSETAARPRPQLVDFELEGSRLRAQFQTQWGPARALWAELRLLPSGGERPSLLPVGWTLRALDELLALLPAGRPRGLGEPPSIRRKSAQSPAAQSAGGRVRRVLGLEEPQGGCEGRET